jgi:hypothetical protein
VPLCAKSSRRAKKMATSATEGFSRVSVESHVIPAKLVLRESGAAEIHFVRNVDPRLRGGDDRDFHFLGWVAGP